MASVDTLATTGPPPEPGSGLEAELGWSLHWVFTGYQRVADPVHADLPGGLRGYKLLVAIEDGHPCSQLELAHRLVIDKAAMTHLVDQLEGGGLVVRRPDPTDRRIRQVVATPAGLAELDRRRTALRAVEGQVLAALSAPDALRLREMLVTVARSIDTAKPSSAPDLSPHLEHHILRRPPRRPPEVAQRRRAP